MKVEVWAEEAKEPVLRLRFFQDGDTVSVAAVDATGKVRAYIARFRPDGTLCLCQGVPPCLGLQLDSQGRITLS